MRTYCNPLISPSLISPASEVNKIVGHPPPQPLISPPLPPFFVYFKYFLDRKLTLNILKLLHQEETNQAGGITVLKKHLHGQNNGHIIIIHENCPFVAKFNKPPPPHPIVSLPLIGQKFVQPSRGYLRDLRTPCLPIFGVSLFIY